MQELKISRRKTLRAQISDYLRESILRGDIKAGSKLPSTTALAEKWGTQTANVHAALSLLVQEGLLTRKNGVGTIVNSRKNEFKSVLIYHSNNQSYSPQNFYRKMLECTQQELEKRNLQWQVIYKNQSQDHFDQVKDLADKGLIQGIIVMSTDHSEIDELKKLPVPFSCITTGRIKNRVSLSFNSLAEKARDGLLQQGCTKAGLLLATSCEPGNESGAVERRNFVRNLRNLLTESGIEVKDEWIFLASENPGRAAIDPDHFAYEGFNQIWQAKEKPNGLFVYTDSLISGTLISILSNRVMVPEQLKLVLHRNSECNVLCPVPCYFVENDIRKMSTGLIQLLEAQYHGQEVNQIDFDYKLIDNT